MYVSNNFHVVDAVPRHSNGMYIQIFISCCLFCPSYFFRTRDKTFYRSLAKTDLSHDIRLHIDDD